MPGCATPGCATPGCTSNAKKGFHLFRFPSSPGRRSRWEEKCRRKNWTAKTSDRLCEIHFEDSQYETYSLHSDRRKLKRTAVPTLFDVPNSSTLLANKRRRTEESFEVLSLEMEESGSEVPQDHQYAKSFSDLDPANLCVTEWGNSEEDDVSSEIDDSAPKSHAKSILTSGIHKLESTKKSQDTADSRAPLLKLLLRNPLLLAPVKKLTSVQKPQPTNAELLAPAKKLTSIQKPQPTNAELLAPAKKLTFVQKPQPTNAELLAPAKKLTSVQKLQPTNAELLAPAKKLTSVQKPQPTNAELLAPAKKLTSVQKPQPTNAELLAPARKLTSVQKLQPTNAELLAPARKLTFVQKPQPTNENQNTDHSPQVARPKLLLRNAVLLAPAKKFTPVPQIAAPKPAIINDKLHPRIYNKTQGPSGVDNDSGSRSLLKNLLPSTSADKSIIVVPMKRLGSDVKNEVSSTQSTVTISEMQLAIAYILANKFKRWFSHSSSTGITIFNINNDVSVEKSINITLDGTTNILVLKQPLVENHSIIEMWKSLGFCLESVNPVADIISLVREVDKLKVCCGNNDETYRHLWNAGHYVYKGSAGVDGSFRVNDCDLLVQGKLRCTNCRMFKHLLRRQHSRELSRARSNEELKSSRTDSSLNKTELLMKLRASSGLIHNLRKKVKRRELHVERLLKKTVKPEVPAKVEEEPPPISPELSEAQQAFWDEQRKAAKVKNAKAMRWNPITIQWAVRILKLSSAAFKAIQESGYISLPSRRTLTEYVKCNKAGGGVKESEAPAEVVKCNKTGVGVKESEAPAEVVKCNKTGVGVKESEAPAEVVKCNKAGGGVKESEAPAQVVKCDKAGGGVKESEAPAEFVKCNKTGRGVKESEAPAQVDPVVESVPEDHLPDVN